MTATGGPPFTLSITGELEGMLLIDDETMALAYGDVVSLIDLRRYTRATSQPPALNTEDETDGNIMGIAHDSTDDRIVAAQVDGDILLFDLNHITLTPVTFTVNSSAQLGPIAVDSAAAVAAVVDTKGKVIYQVNLNTRSVVNSAAPTIGTNTTFSIENAFFLEDNSTFYFTTDSGALFAIRSGSSSVTTIDVNTTTGIDLAGMAATPDFASLYVVDKTTPGVVKIDTATNTVLKRATDIPLSANAGPTDIVITEITNPVSGSGTATYAFVSGTDGISVLNTANDEIFDLGNPDDTDIDDEPIPTSVQPELLAASSSTDGYVYLGNSTGSVGLLSANPWITISSLAYSGGGSSLTTDGTATLTFQSDRTGSYSVRVGGGVTANGTVVNLEGGAAATGTVDTADTALSLVIPYTSNSSVLSEGSNNLFVFVTDSSSNRGRIATTLTVDTPPPAVTIESVGYGNGKIYVNMTRLTQSDINRYNIYVSAVDAATATTKTDVDLQVGQPSAGDTVTAEVTGLTNGTTHYVAVTATDNGGNESAARTSTLADGSAASGLPQVTSGPAGLAGERGCSLLVGDSGDKKNIPFVLSLSAVLLFIFLRRVAYSLRSENFGRVKPSPSLTAGSPTHSLRRKHATLLFLVLIIFFVNGNALASSPFTGAFELKTGFWMPQHENLKTFFEPCCNLMTRVQGGAYLQRRYGAEASLGFLYDSGAAVGVISTTPSQDRYRLLLFPAEMSLVLRADYFPWRYLVPFVKAGGDAVMYRESLTGDSITGVKYGAHGAGGLEILLTNISDSTHALRSDFGIDDLFATLELQYSWIDTFGGTGLDLSGLLYSVGLLVQF